MLTQVAGENLIPPDDVRRAWRFHAARGPVYEGFCREVFGRVLPPPFDIEDADECEQRRARYVATLARYRRAFDADAPWQVWPDADAVAAAPPPEDPSLLHMRGLRSFGELVALALVAGAIGLSALCNRLGLLAATHEIGDTAFVIAAASALVALFVLLLLDARPSVSASPRDTLDAYEAALLAGGAARVAATAIGVLVALGFLEIDTTRRRRGLSSSTGRLVTASGAAAPGTAKLHPVELACLAAARGGELTFDQARAGLEPWADWMTRRLVAAGLMRDGTHVGPWRAAAVALATGYLVVAGERLIYAAHVGGSGAVLVILSLFDITLIFALTKFAAVIGPRGRRALESLREALRPRLAAERREATRAGKPPAADARLLPTTLALSGPVAVLDHPTFRGLDLAIGRKGMRLANPSDD